MTTSYNIQFARAVHFGQMQVDWETRIDFEKMRRERLQRAREAMAKNSLDYLILLRIENARYVTGIKRLYWPTIRLGGGPVVVLPQQGDPGIWITDPNFACKSLTWVPSDRFRDAPEMELENEVEGFIDSMVEMFGKSIEKARIGVDIDNLLISQPDTGEQALEITETLVRSGAIDIVVIDSVAALVPRAEIEGDMGDASMGMQARLMSQALRKLSGAINQTKTAVIFTNQMRQKIGVMFGSPETTTGGLALKFYTSVRLDVRRIQSIKMGAEIIGNRVRVRVVKNKVAPPFRVAEFDIMYNEGISKSGDLIDLGTQMDIITKRGSFYSYGDIRLGQGRENAKEFLKQSPEISHEIEMAIRQQASSMTLPMSPGLDDGDDDAESNYDE